MATGANRKEGHQFEGPLHALEDTAAASNWLTHCLAIGWRQQLSTSASLSDPASVLRTTFPAAQLMHSHESAVAGCSVLRRRFAIALTFFGLRQCHLNMLRHPSTPATQVVVVCSHAFPLAVW